MTAGLAPLDKVTTPGFTPGSLVAVRGREWVVLPGSTDDFLLARPLGGTDDDIAGILVGVEKPRPARFAPPSPDDLGDQLAAGLLRTALRVGFRATAGPFRSLASLAVEPRPYQLVPLLLALRQSVVRLLIADDVGIGKTIEAGLIAAELLASGDARGLSVLCSPALAEQWQEELRTKFAIDAELVLAGTAKRLERSTVGGESVFSRYPFTVVSTDFIKSPTRRHEYLQECPDLVIVDEAHTCVADDSTTGGKSRQQRYDLVRELAADPARHLLLVTATPHSGKDATFRNLLGLLDPTLAGVDLDQAAGREQLAGHLVQRRRADIRRYLDEDTPFPADRLTKEVAYALTPEYHDLFDRVLAHARELVRDRGDGVVRQRVRWWSALALLRALASSPRAAAQTLRNRAANANATSFDEADRLGRAVVFDSADDEAVEAVDTAPGADPETGESDTEPRRRLRSLANAADALAGPLDAKLTAVTKVVTQLLADGYDPIVFCRFIETAEYVGEHLQAKLRKNATVGVVTGTLPPPERRHRIADLTAEPGRHVLVATDCLSEGVNLQDGFQAVVHYDLAWNPTRHEQREGRVDRFGQRFPVVRAVTIYGKDNAIDGIVLDVLLRKHEAIRKATGVSVPVPDESGTVLEAVLEGLLLRNRQPEQLELDLGFQERGVLHAEWDSAAEKEKASVTKYAQRRIQPQQVARELAEVRATLGTPAEVRGFTRDALVALGSTVSTEAGAADSQQDSGFTATTAPLPVGLRDTLPPPVRPSVHFHRDLPVPRGDAVLHRTDPNVESVARFVLDAALDPTLPAALRPARRCGVIRTRAVEVRTTLLLVRYRFHLTLPSRTGERTLVAEDAALIAVQGSGEDLVSLDDDAVRRLVGATADANLAPDAARDFAERALRTVDGLGPVLDERGDQLASRLLDAHRRVRQSSLDVRRGLAVQVQRPADVLGVYVYLPAGPA